MKRVFCVLLALALCLTFLPAAVMAEEDAPVAPADGEDPIMYVTEGADPVDDTSVSPVPPVEEPIDDMEPVDEPVFEPVDEPIAISFDEHEPIQVYEPVPVDVAEPAPVPAEPESFPLAGGFTEAEDKTINEERQAIFNAAMSGLSDARYYAVAYAGSQVVAGMNHWFVAVRVWNSLSLSYQLVYVKIYQALDGTCELVEIKPISIVEAAALLGIDLSASGEPTGEPSGEPSGEPTGEPSGEPIVITRQPELLAYYTDNKPAVFTIEAEGVGLTYQWQIGLLGHYVNIPGATQPTLTVSRALRLLETIWASVRCVVTDAYGNTAVSDAGYFAANDPGIVVYVDDDGAIGAYAYNCEGLYARVAMVLRHGEESGLYVYQGGIDEDGFITISDFNVPGLTVTAVCAALVPTLEDITSPTPEVIDMDKLVLDDAPKPEFQIPEWMQKIDPEAIDQWVANMMPDDIMDLSTEEFLAWLDSFYPESIEDLSIDQIMGLIPLLTPEDMAAFLSEFDVDTVIQSILPKLDSDTISQIIQQLDPDQLTALAGKLTTEQIREWIGAGAANLEYWIIKH